MTALNKLAFKVLEKPVWGCRETEPWYDNPGGLKIGEIWFTASPGMPLVKLLFTSDKLSIQVHPDDTYAEVHENSPGKTEMWHILRAEPGSQVGVGLNSSLTRDELREACETGSVADRLTWVAAAPGDTFFIPAGTIHAIGGGLVLCEIQQPSDVTYRLHDYGRRPDLQIAQSLDVSRAEPYDGRVQPSELGENRSLLAECPYFRTERLEVIGSAVCPAPLKPTLYIAIAGEGDISGQAFKPGEAWEAEAGAGAPEIRSPRATFILVTR